MKDTFCSVTVLLSNIFYDILLKYTVTSNVEVVIRSRDLSSLLVAIYLF